MEYIKKKILYLSMISKDINNKITTYNVRKESYTQILDDLKTDLNKIDKKNNDTDFVTYDKMKEYMQNGDKGPGLKQFKEWETFKSWNNFHRNHYDWWVFPIPDPSSNKLKYSVFLEDIKILKEDKDYVANLKECARIICLAWGWDLNKKKYIDNPDTINGQKWQDHPIRLFKMILSLLCFELIDEANSAIQLGKSISNINYIYSGRDYRYLFA
jgi:hypothetical protein